MPKRFQRVLLKLSGEALEGPGCTIDPEVLRRIAGEIGASCQAKSEVAVVLGGGNLFRGMSGASAGMDRPLADSIGMLATVMNCLALQDALRQQGQAAIVLSAIAAARCPLFDVNLARNALEKGTVVLLAGGTGNPFFTTDSAAALRALELQTDVLLKATKVDGIYDKDPTRNRDARRFERLSYDEVLQRRLGVMDLTAITLCRDNAMPLIVFDMTQRGNIQDVIQGRPVGSRVDAEP